jgi:hypothetical protein
MKNLLLILLLLPSLLFGKTLKKASYISQYNNQKVVFGISYPDNYDSTKSYPVLYAEGGNGEKDWERSTEANWDVRIYKSGQAIYEFHRSTKNYQMIVVQALWPYAPGEPVITELKTTQRRYGALMKELIDKTTGVNFKTDPSRLYISGLSEGGGDVWECLTQWGNKVAACVAIACWNPSSKGTEYTTYADANLAKCGTVVLQVSGDNDPNVGYAQGALNMAYYIGQMKKLGMNCDIVVSQEDGHNAWIPIFQNRMFPSYPTCNGVACVNQPTDIYEWLLSKRRTDVVAIPEGPKDTVIPPPVSSNAFVCDSLQATVHYMTRAFVNGYHQVCTVTNNFKVDSVSYDWKANPIMNSRKDSVYMNIYGRFKVLKSGSYTFRLNTDDGSNLWINGVKVISDWTNHGVRERFVTVNLVAGVWNTIAIDYYEAQYDASLKCEVEGPELPKQVIKRIK